MGSETDFSEAGPKPIAAKTKRDEAVAASPATDS